MKTHLENFKVIKPGDLLVGEKTKGLYLIVSKPKIDWTDADVWDRLLSCKVFCWGVNKTMDVDIGIVDMGTEEATLFFKYYEAE